MIGRLTRTIHRRRGGLSPGTGRAAGVAAKAVGMQEAAMSRQPGPRPGRCLPTPDQQGNHAGPERLGLHGGVGGALLFAVALSFLSGCHESRPRCTSGHIVALPTPQACESALELRVLVLCDEQLQSVLVCDEWEGMPPRPTPGLTTYTLPNAQPGAYLQFDPNGKLEWQVEP